jgi:hypothetical protein
LGFCSNAFAGLNVLRERAAKEPCSLFRPFLHANVVCCVAGAPTAAGGLTTSTRRCLTYRTQMLPLPKSTDCNLKMNDFNFALYGKHSLM